MRRDSLLCVLVRCDLNTVIICSRVNKLFYAVVKSEIFLQLYKNVNYVEYNKLKWLEVFKSFDKKKLRKIDSYNFNTVDTPTWVYEKYPDNFSLSNYVEKSNVDIGFIDKHFSELSKYSIAVLCQNNSVPIWFYEKHINKLSWAFICMNTSIPIWFYEKYFDKIDNSDMLGLFQNSSVPLSFYEKYDIDIDDYSDYISRNTNITIDFIEANYDDVNWFDLCQNTSVPLHYIENNKSEVDWTGICGREITPDELWFYDKYIDNLDWSELNTNPSIPDWWFEKHITHIDWDRIYLNRGLSSAFIEKYISHMPFFYMNSNINPEFLLQHIDVIDINELQKNPSIPYQCFLYLLHKK